MADKEKLIELLEDVDGETGFRLLGYQDIQRIADQLIANGITVRRWIPVTERMPERFKEVLLWDAIDKTVFTGELDDDDDWFIARFQNEAFNITHWMPLPEPPKEE